MQIFVEESYISEIHWSIGKRTNRLLLNIDLPKREVFSCFDKLRMKYLPFKSIFPCECLGNQQVLLIFES
jgi:hypothetical protein